MQARATLTGAKQQCWRAMYPWWKLPATSTPLLHVVNRTWRWQHPNTTTCLLSTSRQTASDVTRYLAPLAVQRAQLIADWSVWQPPCHCNLKTLRPSCQVDKTCFWRVKYRYDWWCPLSIALKAITISFWGRKNSWQLRCPLLMLSIIHCTRSQYSWTLWVTAFNPTA